jgi:hypothetical protein
VKKLQLLTIALLFFTIACKKSGEKVLEPIENSLIATWTYTEYYFGGGRPGEWHPVTPNQTIEFKANGTFIPCESFLKDANHFEILDSVTVKFRPASTDSGFILMRYSIDTGARELLMSPIPLCIEGCSSKFKR